MDYAMKGLNVIVLNPTAVIGPNDYRPSLLGKAMIRFAQGRIPALVNGGYDWVDVRDIVNATLAALTQGEPGSKYMLSGHWKSMKELGEAIYHAGGAKPPVFMAPFSLALAGAGILNIMTSGRGEAKLFTPVSLVSLRHGHRNISHEKAGRQLGYHPRPFEETVADTVRWFKANNYF
jgi:dihydroflavonol-4-reductase